MAENDMVFPPEPLNPEVLSLSMLDQHMVGAYVVRFILSFPLLPGSSPTDIFKTLQVSLSNTIAAIPSIAGHVVRTDSQVTLNIKADSGVRLVYKDLTTAENKIPGVESYQKLASQNFPVEKVPESSVSPVGLIPECFTDAPAVAAQCNFLQDGVLLCVAFHHSAFDTKGSGAIVTRWAEERRILLESGSKSARALPKEALDRISPFPPAGIKFDKSLLPDWTTEPEVPQGGPHDAKIKTFHFTPITLTKLKGLATSKSPDASWISTNDALSAFLWHTYMRARNPELLASSSHSNGDKDILRTFACAVDFRNRLKPPVPHYLGNASCFQLTPLKLSYLLQHPIPPSEEVSTGRDIPLAQTAQAIRQSVNQFDSTHVHKIVSLVASTPITEKLRQNPGDGVFLVNSWAEISVGTADFGPGLGKPDRVRLPMPEMSGVGAALVLPKAGGDGGLDVLASMNEEALERAEKELKGWCSWVD